MRETSQTDKSSQIDKSLAIKLKIQRFVFERRGNVKNDWHDRDRLRVGYHL